MRELPDGIDASLAAEAADRGVQLFIDGEHRPARSGRTFESVDPFSAEPWHLVADADAVSYTHLTLPTKRIV